MDRHEDSKLWDLLGKSSAPELRSDFADRTLRRIRLEDAEIGSNWSYFPHWLRWAFGPAIALGVVVLLSVTIQQQPDQSSASAEIAEITSTAQLLAVNDLTEVDRLDVFLAEDDNALWLENTF